MCSAIEKPFSCQRKISMRTAMLGMLGILTCITCSATPNYALICALLETENIRIDVYMEHSKLHVFNLKNIGKPSKSEIDLF